MEAGEVSMARKSYVPSGKGEGSEWVKHAKENVAAVVRAKAKRS